jgi:hypothetical protein
VRERWGGRRESKGNTDPFHKNSNDRHVLKEVADAQESGGRAALHNGE